MSGVLRRPARIAGLLLIMLATVAAVILPGQAGRTAAARDRGAVSLMAAGAHRLTGDLICDKGDPLCLSSFNGHGQPVDTDTQNLSTAHQRWELVRVDPCNSTPFGVVTSTCPFTEGSGMNSARLGHIIFEVQSQDFTGDCAVMLTSNHNGSLQGCGHAGTNYVLDGFAFDSVAESNLYGNFRYACSSGINSAPLFTRSDFAGDSCRWLDVMTGGPLAPVRLTAAQRFTCPQNSFCVFANTDYTGFENTIPAAQINGNRGTWVRLPDGTRGSLSNKTLGDNITVYSAQSGAHLTIPSGQRDALAGIYGWWCTGTWSLCNHNLPGVLRLRLTGPAVLVTAHLQRAVDLAAAASGIAPRKIWVTFLDNVYAEVHRLFAEAGYQVGHCRFHYHQLSHEPGLGERFKVGRMICPVFDHGGRMHPAGSR